MYGRMRGIECVVGIVVYSDCVAAVELGGCEVVKLDCDVIRGL